jgi:hypothetical protein
MKPVGRTRLRQSLAASVQRAEEAMARLRGTHDTQLQQVLGKLVVQTTLANDAIKHPEMLRR